MEILPMGAEVLLQQILETTMPAAPRLLWVLLLQMGQLRMVLNPLQQLGQITRITAMGQVAGGLREGSLRNSGSERPSCCGSWS
jgi:hypothetical protein